MSVSYNAIRDNSTLGDFIEEEEEKETEEE